MTDETGIPDSNHNSDNVEQSKINCFTAGSMSIQQKFRHSVHNIVAVTIVVIIPKNRHK